MPQPEFATPSVPVVDIEALRFRWSASAHHELSIARLQIQPGQAQFVSGPSGSGKSTLLALLAGLVRPQSGSIRIAGECLSSLRRGQRDRFRANHMGIIFQQFNLVPYLTPLENVLLPCHFSRYRRHRAGASPRGAALALMADLGLDVDSLPRDVRHLSIGQQQRVAAARALIGDPELILADEPTSALDTEHRDRFLGRLLSQVERHNGTLIFVSHDEGLADRFHVRRDIRDWWREVGDE